MKKNLTIGLALAVILAMVLSTVALADSVVNKLDDTIDSALETVTINTGGTATVGFYLTETNGTPVGDRNGCNAQENNPVVVTFDVPTGVTASKASLSFIDCNTIKSIDFSASPTTPTSYTISVSSITGGKVNSLYDGAPAAFTLNVEIPAPSNTAPKLTLPSDITAEATGALGVAVTYTATASDKEDGALTPVCLPESGSTFALGTTAVNCSVTDSGGLSASGSFTVTVKDTTAPVIAAHADVTAEATSASGAIVSYTGPATSDAVDGAGVAVCDPASGSLFPLGDTTVTCNATDAAGNAATATTFKVSVVDTTPPDVQCGTADDKWHATDVSIACTATDLVGLANPVTDASFSLSTSVTSGTEDANASTDSREVCDQYNNCKWAGPIAGNMVDKKAPVVTCGSADSLWHPTDVSIACSATDGGSGLADTLDANFTLSTSVAAGTETSNASTGTHEVKDAVGNSSTAGPISGNMVDKRAPTNIAFIDGSIMDGASYYFGFVPAGPTTCTASDAGSGLRDCVVSGGGLSVGAHSFVATATDNVGNFDTAKLNYTVLAWTLKGFYQPVDMPTLLNPVVLNTVKNGSTVPLKFEIFAGSTELTDIPSVKTLTYAKTACSADAPQDAIETTATGGTSLRYDSVAGQFVYNWKTPATAGVCYKVTMTTQDGSTLSAFFKLK